MNKIIHTNDDKLDCKRCGKVGVAVIRGGGNCQMCGNEIVFCMECFGELADEMVLGVFFKKEDKDEDNK